MRPLGYGVDGGRVAGPARSAATTWLARDLRHPVALKVFQNELGSAVSRERFHRETHIAATLQHLGIPLVDGSQLIGVSKAGFLQN